MTHEANPILTSFVSHLCVCRVNLSTVFWLKISTSQPVHLPYFYKPLEITGKIPLLPRGVKGSFFAPFLTVNKGIHRMAVESILTVDGPV